MSDQTFSKVVAEGVENEAQWAFLKKNHCNIAQGYLMGQSMNAADFVKHLYQIG